MWTGAMYLKTGYGHFNVARKSVSAHRFAFREFNGPIPAGMVVRHTCDVKHCVNPEHLVLGTQAENIEDATKKARHCHGESHGCAKIPEGIARELKLRLGMGRPCTELAVELGIPSVHIVYDIKRGKTWGHLTLT